MFLHAEIGCIHTYTYVCVYIHTHSILFLWKTLINTHVFAQNQIYFKRSQYK